MRPGRAYALALDVGDEREVSRSLQYRAAIAFHQDGDLASARELTEEAARLNSDRRDEITMRTYLNLGTFAAENGEYDEAEVAVDTALELGRQLHAWDGVHRALVLRSGLHMLKDEFVRALSLAEEAQRIVDDRLQSPFDRLVTLGTLVDALLLGGDVERAERVCYEFQSALRDADLTSWLAASLYGASCVAAARGDRERAGVLWAAATVHAVNYDLNDGGFFSAIDRKNDERFVQPLLATADDATRERWEQEGRALTLEQAVEYALQPADRGQLSD